MAIRLGCIRGVVTVYFSYTYRLLVPEEGVVARQNVWGPTTGGHLNKFSDPKNRISGAEFESVIKQCLSDMG